MIVLYRLDGFIGCQDRMCEIRVIDERRFIAVTPFGILWRSGCIFGDGYLETCSSNSRK